MKKTAVLIYDQFCNFEIVPALEMLAIAEKPIAILVSVGNSGNCCTCAQNNSMSLHNVASTLNKDWKLRLN